VIGLGIMGSAVARHLAAAGRNVIGFDIDASRAEAVAGPRFRQARGGRGGGSVRLALEASAKRV
jgi:3-hydroxyisobutyrate dehydrogenase-like beta-hydroxyacid dehydrogenase